MTETSASSVERIYLAMGCFWGAEELYWQTDGVLATSVGYMGGRRANPSYEQVCTGATGHAETVCVDYDPQRVSTLEILRLFWEHHDPTQGDRQGNDIGSQYRSAVFATTAEQAELVERTRDAYQAVIAERGYGTITTELLPAADYVYYPAEAYHQRYLEVHPNGYRCHANTGIALPAIA